MLLIKAEGEIDKMTVPEGSSVFKRELMSSNTKL
jgi:hypothetical protein